MPGQVAVRLVDRYGPVKALDRSRLEIDLRTRRNQNDVRPQGSAGGWCACLGDCAGRSTFGVDDEEKRSNDDGKRERGNDTIPGALALERRRRLLLPRLLLPLPGREVVAAVITDNSDVSSLVCTVRTRLHATALMSEDRRMIGLFSLAGRDNSGRDL